MPSGTGSRTRAEPLLAIADLAGESGRNETIGVSRTVLRARAQDQSVGTRLLADIRTIFELKGIDKVASVKMIGALVEMETSPWAEFNYGKQLTPNTLARLLKPFDITLTLNQQ